MQTKDEFFARNKNFINEIDHSVWSYYLSDKFTTLRSKTAEKYTFPAKEIEERSNILVSREI